jgi:iron complex outermembrane receptor protein
VDWDRADWGATATLRYISKITESTNANKMGSRTYLDAQVRWTPSFLTEGLRVAVGVNNLLDKDPPGCISCGLNNYDPNAYDAPGRFWYLRLSYRQ